MRQDYHLHTSFSPDGHDLPEAMIHAARNAGIDDIIFTDHCECQDVQMPEGYPEWPPLDERAYTDELTRLRKKYDFGIGVELGQATQCPERAKYISEYREWDFVLGSLHNLKDGYDFYFYDKLGLSVEKALPDYFEQLMQVAQKNMFSVLSHLTYPVKLIIAAGKEFDMKPYYSDISQILRLIIENGKGIELNFSPMFRCPGVTMPDIGILKLYRSLGGEILTLGSDSHSTETVGVYNADAEKIAADAGFRYITKFRKMKPEQIRL